MIHRVVQAKGWTVDLLFAYPENDPDLALSCLHALGAPPENMMDAERLMDGRPNFGFTFSNGYRRRCLTWVGPQEDGSQWVNTIVHEIVHIAVAIAIDSGIDLYTEDFAYLVGDITQEMADIICHLSCDLCRDEKND